MSNTILLAPSTDRGSEAGNESPERPTVVVTNHDAEMRADIRTALENDGFEVLAEASSVARAIQAVLRHRPEICLLDADLPGKPLGAVKDILTELPDTRIGMLADSPTSSVALRAIQGGADGVLNVGAPSEQLTAGVRALARGELPLPRALTARVVQEWRAPILAARTDENDSRIATVLLYLPRFLMHFHRRLRSQMEFKLAWASARERMHYYR